MAREIARIKKGPFNALRQPGDRILFLTPSKNTDEKLLVFNTKTENRITKTGIRIRPNGVKIEGFFFQKMKINAGKASTN
jgi:hypothetical protein